LEPPHYHGMQVWSEYECSTIGGVVSFEAAKAITQRLVDEGIIQSTVENDLRGDVA